MTLFAVGCAGLFPILHLGRPWFFYWLLPYPGHDGPLAAVAQPAGLGLLRGRDLSHRFAALLVRRPGSRSRDAARPRALARPRSFYGLRARLARLRAALDAISTGVSAARGSRDAARRLGAQRGRRSTSRCAYCPAGTRRSFRPTSSRARSSRASRWCSTIALPLRQVFQLENLITTRHLDVIGKVLLAAGLVVTYGYLMEHFSPG